MSATKEFRVGDTVKMSDIGKKQYQDAKYNPYDLTGVITKVNSIIVKWSNGETNSYDPRHIELVEPKQEQYYTSIPTDVKVGDKFKLVYTKSIGTTSEDMDIKWCSDRGFNIGDIVFLKHNDGSSCPKFENNGKTLYLNWGWLKPVEEEYKVGDWVLLINSNFNSHVSDMNKFKGTIQQIGSTNKYSKDIFYLKDDDKMWAFVLSDFVKKVDAPVTQCKLVDVPSKTLTGRNTTSTDVQQFKIGDEVELINNKTTNNNGRKESNTNSSMSFSTTSYKITRGEDCRTSSIRCTKSKIKI